MLELGEFKGYTEIKVEPYWNVNFFRNTLLQDVTPIKVEPYWNVNVLGAIRAGLPLYD